MDSGGLTPVLDASCQDPRLAPDRVMPRRARASEMDAEPARQPQLGNPRGASPSDGQRARQAVEHRDADEQQPGRPGWDGTARRTLAVRTEILHSPAGVAHETEEHLPGCGL